MTSLSRVVRIFISSTFRDFDSERDLLVRKIFPELRRCCRVRQVELVDVDLRWGITEVEAQQGKVLPICLAEIDRSRPYFIGLLGERYGWVPEEQQYDSSLIEEQEWLKQHRGGRSITELEVLHGVLNNPAMAGHALFYFRNPTYGQERGSDYAAESPEHRDKLTQLKDRIRQSGFPVVEDYPDPEALAQRVQEDLWKLIDATYPLDEVPDALALERRRHESYGQSRLGLYLGGENYLASLDTFIREDRRTVLIRGESGGGKSALVANWFQQFREAQSDAHVFVHHLGSTNDAGEPTKLVRRWIQELARVLGEEAKLPGEPDKLYEELPQWLAKASAHAQKHGTRWLIVLDALDKLREGRDLRWLPSFLPAHVQLIASCLTGDVLTAAQRRLTWEQEIKVKPLEKSDQQHLIRKFLSKYSKKLTPTQEAIVLAHPLAANPLFLLTLLYEFRVHGEHEFLEKRIRTLLSPPASKGAGEAPTVDDVFEHVLERVEADTVAQHVRVSMEAIWASRAGLAQDELLAIANVAPLQWAAVQLGLEEMLLESGGRWTFAHDFGRKAVQDRYGLVGEAKVRAHRTLAEYFARLPVGARVAEELPWQWERAGEKERLKDCLTDRELFAALKERDEYELLAYWVRLGSDVSAEYAAALPRWGVDGEEVALTGWVWVLADFLSMAGYYTAFELEIREVVVDVMQQLGADHADMLYHPDMLVAMTRLSNSYRQAGRLEEALGMREEVLRLRLEKLGMGHPDTLGAMGNLASSYSDAGRLEKVLGMREEVLRLMREKLGGEHPNTLTGMNNLAKSYYVTGRLGEALEIQEEVLRLRREKLGVDHPDTLVAMNNLASFYLDAGRMEEAVGMWEEVLRLRREKLGADHPDTLRAMGNLGKFYCVTGRLEEALGVIAIIEEWLGRFADHHEEMASVRTDLMTMLSEVQKLNYEDRELMKSAVRQNFLAKSSVKIQEKMEITMEVKKISIGFGWEPNDACFSWFDVFAFMLGEDFRYANNRDVVFYNNLQAENGSLATSDESMNDFDACDDQTFMIDIETIDFNIHEIRFFFAADQEEHTKQNFGKANSGKSVNCYMRIYDSDSGREICYFKIEIKNLPVIEGGKLYRSGDNWVFQASGESLSATLPELVDQYCRN